MSGSYLVRDGANGWCADVALAAGATTTFDVSNLADSQRISCIRITADVDASLTAKWGAAAPAAGGTAGTPVAGFSEYVGPSYPPVILHATHTYTTLGLKNTSGVAVNFKLNAYLASPN